MRRYGESAAAMALLGCLALAQPSCSSSESGSDDGANRPGEPASERVGPTGGVVTASGASVDIPGGALGQEVEIEVSTVDLSALAALPMGAEPISDAFAFTPHGQTFDSPVTISIPLTSTTGEGMMFRLPHPGASTWETVEADIRDGAATATTNQFSVYVVATCPDCAAPQCPDTPSIGCSYSGDRCATEGVPSGDPCGHSSTGADIDLIVTALPDGSGNVAWVSTNLDDRCGPYFALLRVRPIWEDTVDPEDTPVYERITAECDAGEEIGTSGEAEIISVTTDEPCDQTLIWGCADTTFPCKELGTFNGLGVIGIYAVSDQDDPKDYFIKNGYGCSVEATIRTQPQNMAIGMPSFETVTLAPGERYPLGSERLGADEYVDFIIDDSRMLPSCFLDSCPSGMECVDGMCRQ